MPHEATNTCDRRSVRQRDYDFSQAGAHFVTICLHQRALLFGSIEGEEMILSDCGQMVQATWDDLPDHPHVSLDAFVIMPNHVHGLLILLPDDMNSRPATRAGFKPAHDAVGTKRHGLPEIIRGFETFSARKINILRGTPGKPVWKRSYYEHVIRNGDELNRAREYIMANPQRRQLDRENPTRTQTLAGAHGFAHVMP